MQYDKLLFNNSKYQNPDYISIQGVTSKVGEINLKRMLNCWYTIQIFWFLREIHLKYFHRKHLYGLAKHTLITYGYCNVTEHLKTNHIFEETWIRIKAKFNSIFSLQYDKLLFNNSKYQNPDYISIQGVTSKVGEINLKRMLNCWYTIQIFWFLREIHLKYFHRKHLYGLAKSCYAALW